MRKAARPSGGMESLNPRRWRGERLHHHGGSVCWLFVLLWMDSWCHELIVCKKWYKNNLKMRLKHYFLIHVGVHHTRGWRRWRIDFREGRNKRRYQITSCHSCIEIDVQRILPCLGIREMLTVFHCVVKISGQRTNCIKWCGPQRSGHI